MERTPLAATLREFVGAYRPALDTEIAYALDGERWADVLAAADVLERTPGQPFARLFYTSHRDVAAAARRWVLRDR